MNVLQYPDYADSNPYQTLMFDALRDQGCRVVSFNGSPRMLLRRLLSDPSDILHLHWISGHVVDPNKLQVWASMAIFATALAIWRLRGKKIVWTLHNLVNHEQQNTGLDRLNSKIVARLADAILIHGESARGAAKEALGVSEEKFFVVPHGNYDGIVAYRPPRDCSKDVGSQGHRFLFAGSIKTYKGVPDLIEAFGTLDGPHHLRIVGHASDPDLKQTIETEACKDSRVTCQLKFVSDAELEDNLGWADVVVMPYRDIFTSGSLLLALTAGRPVVAPNIGLIPDYVDEKSAYLYSAAENNGLSKALEKAAKDSELKDRSQAARRAADKVSWESVVNRLIVIYENLVTRGKA